jgi:2-iminobutanoate/2-iminopropanoate deaminase
LIDVGNGRDGMTNEAVSTDQAPKAIGAYSQAVASGDLVFCSGQLGIDPATGMLAEGLEGQTHRALQNLQSILSAAGLSMSNVVKTTIWLTNSDHFAAVNGIYAEYMGDPPPARSAPVVTALPYPGALLSIEAIAVRRS